MCCFASLQKQQERTRRQETKNTRNQKKQDCTPQGGSSGKELGLVILFSCFFVFSFLCLFFGGFCLAIAEMPSRNCQCLHSSDIANADVPSGSCQCMRKRTVKQMRSEDVPFCKKMYASYEIYKPLRMVIISFTPLLLIISSQLFSAHLSPSQPFSFSSAVFNSFCNRLPP